MPTARLALLMLLAALSVAACGGGTAASASVDTGASQPPASASEPASDAPSAPSSAVCGTAPVPADATVQVTIASFAFSPEPIQAKVGDVIAWTNQDTPSHTATVNDKVCSTGTLATGITGALVFNVPGTYKYFCEVHPGQMKDFTIEIQ